MGLFSFNKKEVKPIQNMDLDIPPPPPKIGLEEGEEKLQEPIDEELAFSSKIPKPPSKPKQIDIEPLPQKTFEEDKPPDLSELLPSKPKKEKKPFFLFRKKKKELPKEEFQFPEIPEEPETIEEPISTGELEKVKLTPKEEPKEVKPQEREGTLKHKFLSLDEFRSLSNTLNHIKEELKNSNTAFLKIDEIIKNKDKKYGEWDSCMEDIQRKIMFVNNTLFER